jgi:uncharacterized damage-inducible protein DinB
MTLVHLSDTAKHWIDVLSLGALVATLLDWIPGVTAILVLLWTAMRIYESWQNITLNRRKLRGE